eukprot:jgi/Undpi1/7993/HiC_scaffold_24.g10465.m1
MNGAARGKRQAASRCRRISLNLAGARVHQTQISFPRNSPPLPAELLLLLSVIRTQVGRGNEAPPAKPSAGGGGANDIMDGFGIDGLFAEEGDVLLLIPRSPVADRVSGGGGGVLQMEKQAPRWPDERGTKGGKNSNSNDNNRDGDVLLLNPRQDVVLKSLVNAPAFDKQLGWRERQAEDACECNERLLKNRAAWGWEHTPDGAERGLDLVERADDRRRPRAATLVDMEKQRPLDAVGGNFLEDLPELAYRNAEYDTDPGVSLSRRRVGVGGVDMRRGRGRGDEAGGKRKGSLRFDGNFRGWCSDGDDGGASSGRGIGEGKKGTMEREGRVWGGRGGEGEGEGGEGGRGGKGEGWGG